MQVLDDVSSDECRASATGTMELAARAMERRLQQVPVQAYTTSPARRRRMTWSAVDRSWRMR
jgi:hypothetical protein